MFDCDSKRIESVQKQFLLFALRNLPWSDPYVRPPYEARLNLLNIDSLADRRTAAACAFMRNYLTDSSIVSNQSPTISNRATSIRSAVNGALRQLPHGRTGYEENSPLRRCMLAFNNHASACTTTNSMASLKSRLRKDFAAGRRAALVERGYL